MKFFESVKTSFLSRYSYFYDVLGYRMLVIIALSIVVGVLDGFGLAMFLPLLEMVAGSADTVSTETLGPLNFLVEGIALVGFELNLTTVLLFMLAFFAIKGLISFYRDYYSSVIRQYFIRIIRVSNINLLRRYAYDKFVMADAGRIQNTMSGEVERVSAAFVWYLHIMMQTTLIVVYGALAFLVNPEFSLLVVLGALLTNLTYKRLYIRTKELSTDVTIKNHEFQGELIQHVAFFKYLKASGLIHQYSNKLIKTVFGIEQDLRKIGTLNAIMSGSREPMLIGVIVGVMLIQVNMMGGNLALILLSILFFYRAMTSVLQLQAAWNNYLAYHGSIDNMKSFELELSNGTERFGNHGIDATNTPVIELRNVDFHYGSTPVLKDITLKIEPNETLAIVGESGSGKTTLMNLLTGLILPTSGELLINGTPITDIDRTTYQQRIGYITQEPVIFSDTIFNNITFWSEPSEVVKKRFYDALKRAHILDFVDSLKDKEFSLLGNNGINISGGQKQRISIARELFKKNDFLFLDEATSSLDSESEKIIQENIEDLKGKYTIVIIAHRLSTIRNADRVIVLKDGTIDKVDTFENLMSRSVVFRRMVELQEV